MSDELMDVILNQTDIAVAIYLPQKKHVEYVSESMKWLLGIDKQNVMDNMLTLFQRFKIPDSSELIQDFCEGNLKVSAQKEFYHISPKEQYGYWYVMKMIPYNQERYILMLTDISEKREMKKTMEVAINAIKRLNESRNEYLYVVDEDVRELITEVARMVADEKIQVTESVKKCMERTGLSYSRFSRLIDKIKHENELEDDKVFLEDKLKRRVEKEEFTGKNILVVEENEINRKIACDFIEFTGANVVNAHNGPEALEIFESSSEGFYDLILMDVNMQVMDGNETAKRLRRLERKDAKIIPIVAMTSQIFGEKIRESLSAGMDMYIAKPLNIRNISIVMKKYC